ncbi:acyl-(acyl carrier protein)--UDP-N-acetylglucosamine/UDP-2-N-acetylglucose-2,3-diamine 3-O/N-acyltransferase [Geotalea daltonii FRC-32]|uniref:Acyl-[acyl-carrier-protein]--UDP-N-acetylglucosamine O-acyltransferase n=1 Tax=Geotalea daltonii (strain DSM 22248 / JCM 15807 / FRC-32) TaxID=316067 RepID=B9M8W0_GEODF|nr:acyl-ACP--UDP-N-acetylglucosamine O-acyltransferase [Geotalea daltonii]ACM20456.1 acyl-(acyl carrier protein)--UDP-N-acetylglucosamine/UDP-2-N-acetylglucose-2,3-diamine 3-O/N-acyltransferase [Geotalea daltonii FRC-32]
MIHSTAVIHSGAELAADVEIGPYAIIGEHVKIGRGTKVGAHAVIDGWTTIGEYNQIFHLASVGAVPQDLKYKGEETYLKIGDRNIIREFATLHLGTVTGDGETTVGNGNLFMAYSHVAHDCHVRNGVVMANAATLAGHVTVEDYAILGGLCAIHQFTRIGAHAMIGGGTLVGMDIPPYTIATGDRRDARLRGLNLVGLKRHNVSDEVVSALKKAYKILALSDMKLKDAIEKIKTEIPSSPEMEHFITFIESAQRGICR